jgi:hypothetical protein
MMAFGRRPGTDFGTAALHAALLTAFCVLAGTGLRIASDDPDAMWLSVLDPFLPMEDLWYRHLVAGMVLAAALVGYALYVLCAHLGARMRFDRARLTMIRRRGKGRYAALNIAVVWVLVASLAVEIVSGVVVFGGAGEGALVLHRRAAWLCMACVVAHVALHAVYGGLPQILRIFNPKRLRIGAPPPDLAELLAEQLRRRPRPGAEGATEHRHGGTRAGSLHAHPLATALLVARLVLGLACASETLTRPVLVITAVDPAQAPRIDGDLSDPVWARTTAVSVMTTQGGDFGGTHQSEVEIRAVHDHEYAYFAFVWEDPTRSLKHHPLVKRGDGWHVAATRADLSDEHVYNEDKFAVLLSASALPLIGGAIHLAHFPLVGKPAASSARGLHYTTDGNIVDVWQWRASHEGPAGHVDNCHFGEPSELASEGELRQYNGGFAVDPGPTAYESNFVLTAQGAARPVRPKRLPRSPAAMARAMGRISEATNESESEHARWWMSESESVPYSEEADAAIPAGTVIPGILMLEVAPRRNAVRGFGRWASGRWTLEVMRRLRTDSIYDVAIESGTLMWVAAFDHSEKRHSRHLRPLRLELEQ